MTKLLVQLCIKGLTIRVGHLGLVELTTRKTGRKDVNKLISRPTLTFFNQWSANLYLFTSFLLMSYW